MDIDPGRFYHFLLYFGIFSCFYSDVHAPLVTAGTVRLLPYSLVLGMLVTSTLFLKAVSTISKQQNSSVVSPNGKQAKLSMFFLCFSTFCIIYTNLFIFVDSLTHFLGNSDIDIVSRARDMATNSVMREIAQEDPQGQSAYQDAVRHHIVATFQRLRLSLLVLDGLMEAYNSSK